MDDIDALITDEGYIETKQELFILTDYGRPLLVIAVVSKKNPGETRAREKHYLNLANKAGIYAFRVTHHGLPGAWSTWESLVKEGSWSRDFASTEEEKAYEKTLRNKLGQYDV